MDPNLFDMRAFYNALSSTKKYELIQVVEERGSSLTSEECNLLDSWVRAKKSDCRICEPNLYRIRAVKMVKNRTGWGLKKAKEECDEYLARYWGYRNGSFA